MDNEGNVTYLHVSSDTYSIKAENPKGVKIDDISKTKSDGTYELLEDAVKTGEGANVVKTATSGVCE